jgi:RNA polymerase sigma-70 factor (ECF subfamily)
VVSELAERKLMQRIAAGDQRAFRALYEQFATPLYRYALLRLRSPTAAEEVVQETLLAVWRNPTAFNGQSRLITYLFGICHHKTVDYIRREAKYQSLEQAEQTTLAVTPDPIRATIAGEALAALPPQMQSVLILVFHYGFGYHEVSQILGIPLGTVKSRVFHARQRLKTWLETEEDEGSV